MKIGIDIDDVLYPWYATAHLLCERAGITNGAKATTWAPHESYGCTRDQWHDVLAAGAISGELYNQTPYAGVAFQLLRLQAEGHTVHLVTARGFLANGDLIKRHTVEWLAEHRIPHDSLTFSKDKRLVVTDWFLDDAVHNYDQLLGHTNVRLLVAEHNQSDPRCERLRVASVVEFVDLVLDGAS